MSMFSPSATDPHCDDLNSGMPDGPRLSHPSPRHVTEPECDRRA
jgi:hypothetical protein